MHMNIEQEILAIKERNRRVEADKAWEVSGARRISIAVMTYVVAAVWLVLINDTRPLLKAFVPAVGYLFSMMSLRAIRERWIKKKLS